MADLANAGELDPEGVTEEDDENTAAAPENGLENAGEDDQGGDAEPTDLEALAMEYGWRPETDYDGDPDKWVDAATFIKNGYEMNKSTMRRQDTDIAEMKQMIDGMRRTQEEAQRRAYERGVEEAKRRQREAVEAGDTEAYEEAEREIAELNKDAPKGDAKKPDDPDGDPHFQAFASENDWYGPDGDPEMTLYAEQTLAPVLNRKYSGAEFYQKVREGMEKKFPDRFGKQQQRKPGFNRVEGGATRGAGGRKKGPSYDDLPDEAKAMCDELVEEGTYKSKDDYVKIYFGQEA